MSCELRPEEVVANRRRGANKILFNHLPLCTSSVVRWWGFWRARVHKDGSAPVGDRLQFNTGWFVLLSANLSVAELPNIAFAQIRLRTTWDTREENASKWLICTTLCKATDLTVFGLRALFQCLGKTIVNAIFFQTATRRICPFNVSKLGDNNNKTAKRCFRSFCVFGFWLINNRTKTYKKLPLQL